MESVLVVGGLGYVGSKLVQRLLKNDIKVTVLDASWFGDWIPDSKNLTKIKADFRNIAELKLGNFDTVFHLANVANDPSVEINETMSWEINVLGIYRLLNWCKSKNISKFLYASSGSVYGISDELKVTEKTELVPISTYNKTKMIAERVVRSYGDYFKIHNVRPGTVCGYSNRMRLDLTVNAMTFDALKNNTINVNGGSQIRPHVHIDDLVSAYLHLAERNLPQIEVNVGFENQSVIETAKIIQTIIPCELNFKESNDPRSYRLDSSLILNSDFSPTKSVRHAIDELSEMFKKGFLNDRDEWHNVKQMRKARISK